jgi:PAS domain S-box-containing protein
MSLAINRKQGFLAWLGGVRGQLIVGVALVHAVMMTLFIWDLTERQQSLLLQRQTEQARTLAESLAVSSAGWLASLDVAGLQEIIDAQRGYAELEFAMILDRSGRIMAHSEHQKAGRYVHDLPRNEMPSVASRSAALVDVFQPVSLGGRTIGWVRVGISQRITGDQLAEITRDGLLYALVAILIGALMAGWLGVRLTRKLYRIRTVTENISAGGDKQRVPALGNDEVGDLARDVNTMLDALDQRDAELIRSSREIALSHAQQHALINAIPDLIWLKDTAGRYLFCNPRFEQFFGESEANILGRTDFDFVDQSLANSFRANDELAMLGDQPRVNEEWLTFAHDGHRELVETIKLPLRDPDAKLIGVLGIARDITERKRSEDLQRYAAFQSGVAEMGVSVLHNIGNAITAMSDDARALRQAIDDFSRVAELLQRGADDSQKRQAAGGLAESEVVRLQAIQREAARTISQLGEQVLNARGENIVLSVQHISDIVRIQQTAALPSASASTFDLGQAIQNALTLQGDSLHQHNIKVEVDIDPALNRVTMAHNQLLQALLNVVKNAYESIIQRQQQEACDGLIELRAQSIGPDRLCLSVRDNGAGFDAEQRPSLFKFGYSTKSRGSGFGLHATALFVQEMGGSITLESEGVNRGALLTIELPCAIKESAVRAVNASGDGTK